MKLGGGPLPSAWPQGVRMPSEGSPPFKYASPESEDLRSTCLTLAAGQAPSGRCRSKPHAPHAETAACAVAGIGLALTVYSGLVHVALRALDSLRPCGATRRSRAGTAQASASQMRLAEGDPN